MKLRYILKSIILFFISILHIQQAGKVRSKKTHFSEEYKRDPNLNKVVCEILIDPTGKAIGRKYIGGSVVHLQEMGIFLNNQCFEAKKDPFGNPTFYKKIIEKTF